MVEVLGAGSFQLSDSKTIPELQYENQGLYNRFDSSIVRGLNGALSTQHENTALEDVINDRIAFKGLRVSNRVT